MASCAACSASARRSRRAATRAQVVLVPESAHGTNPATAAFAGYRVENIPANAAGRVDLEALKARLGPDVAAVMITNPNTCGLFEPDMKAISDAVHAAGALRLLRRRQFQRDRRQGPPRRPRHRRDAHQPAQDLLDPARRRRAGLGPGGAVGSAGAVRAAAVRREISRRQLQAGRGGDMPARSIRDAFGRMVAFHGQMGMFTRALDLHPQPRRRRPAAGRRGRVLNANYILRSLEDVLDAPFAHERAVHARGDLLATTASPAGFSHDRLAKALIDEGFHPMTMYFPLVVHGAMLVEPTETESQGEPRPVHRRAALDRRAGEGGRREPQGRAGPRAAAPARRDAGGAQAGADLSRRRSRRRPAE